MAEAFIPVARPDIGALEQRFVAEAMQSGWISSIGPFIDRFEREFAAFCGARHGIAVSNGTTALSLALSALRIGRGDEVVIPALTFAAVGATVVHAGATPVLADIDPDHWCVDPRAVERALSPRTRAVVAAHSYGHPADLDPLLELCRLRGVHLIEDAAEAHGARYKGRRVGALGSVGSFSFYGNKIITCGEGGMVLTEDDALASRMRMLKDHAMDPRRRYYHLEAGFNFRMTNVQAALGCAQMRRIDEFIARRDALLADYRAALSGTDLELNPRRPWAEPVNWITCARLDAGRAARRDELLTRLKAAGVDTRPFFVPLGDMPPYRGARRVGLDGEGTPVAERLSRSAFNLPTSTTLTQDDVATVAAKLRAALASL
jgi:perosamine synthetase